MIKTKTKKNDNGILTTTVDHAPEDGLRLSTLGQRIYMSKSEEYRKAGEQFFWIYMEYANLLNLGNYDLEKQDVTRLVYIACHIGNEGYLVDNLGFINKKRLKQKMNLTNKVFYELYNKLIEYEILIEKENKLFLKEDLFSRGKLSSITKKENDYTRIYIDSVKYIYENVSSKFHSIIGIYFAMIPFAHRQTNVICLNPESQKSEMIPITISDLATIVDYRKNVHDLIRELLKVRINGNESLLGFWVNSEDEGSYYIKLNPRIIYGGSLENRFTDEESYMFKVKTLPAIRKRKSNELNP